MKRPNVLKIGAGCLAEVAQTLSDYGISGKILYVSGPTVDRLYGQTVRKQLEQIGLTKTDYVSQNAISYAMTFAERIIATDVNCIVGMGGGKVLDVCKYAAYISKKPFLSIPTTMSNDGIASPIAVLKKQDGKPKSLGCEAPSMLILDTDVIINGPVQMIRAGVGDTISNYMALRDWNLACMRGKDEMNGYAYLMSQTSLDALMKTQYQNICPRFIRVLANSLVLSGVAMDFAGSSRPVSGSEHLFSHALDYYGTTENLHGIQVALGTVAGLKLIEEPYDNILEYLNRFGVEINPIKLGISKETFVYCFQHASSMRANRYTCLHETNLSTKRLENIYLDLTKEL